MHAHFGVLADLQFYGAVVLELQAPGHVATINTNQSMRRRSIGRKDHVSGYAQGCMQRHGQA